MHPSETESPRSADDRPAHTISRPVDDPRVYLAAERTFLAWVRTSISLMGFGFLIARFAFWMREYVEFQGLTSATGSHSPISPWLGFGMVVVGVLVCVMAANRHYDYVRDLKAGIVNPSLKIGWSLMVAAVLALVGLAMAVQILFYSG